MASLDEVTAKVVAATKHYDFQAAYNALYHFCTVTLSARYFDIIKDRLYIFAPKSDRAAFGTDGAVRIADSLCRLLSPILVFTSDEAWENLPGQSCASVHMAEFPDAAAADNSGVLAANWERIFSIRDEVLKALEEARNANRSVRRSRQR